MKDRLPADDIVQGAANRALLDLIIQPMRNAAKDCGYAILVHGSLNRDIDILAMPWVEHNVDTIDTLVARLQGAIMGVVGRCLPEDKWTIKPHGRMARMLLIYVGETSYHLDFSVIKPKIE